MGLVHAPFALLPTSFPEGHWKQACEVAPIFNELVDRVSQDGEFLQETLSRLCLSSSPNMYVFIYTKCLCLCMCVCDALNSQCSLGFQLTCFFPIFAFLVLSFSHYIC